MRHPLRTGRRAGIVLFALWMIAGAAGAAPKAELWALELGVGELDRAVEFYTTALGFEALAGETSPARALLGNGPARLALARSDQPVAPAGRSRAYPNFSVGDLDAAARAVTEAGGSVEEPFESPVGMARRFVDPFGHPGYLIDHPWDEMTAQSRPEVFNVALNVRDVEASERYYAALGFRVRTRDYLPETLVFELQGSAQLIVHPNAEAEADPGTEAGALWLDVDPGAALAALSELAMNAEAVSPATAGAPLELRDPSGIPLKLARRAAESASAPEAAAPR